MRLFLIISIIFSIFLGGCEKGTFPQEKAKSLPLILVSVPPYNYLVKKIVGESALVENLLPVGADPHSFEPSHRQMEVALTADLWFYIGEPLDQKIIMLLKEKKSKTVFYDLREGITLLPVEKEHPEKLDINIWLSPKLAKIQVKNIEAVLSLKYPENKRLYQQNLKNLLKELSSLDDEVSFLLKGSKGSAILVSHPAYTYLCDEYGINQLPLEEEGQELDPKHLVTILEAAKEKGVSKVIAQKYHNNKAAIMISRRLNLPLFTLDPNSPDYLDNMLEIAKTLSDP